MRPLVAHCHLGPARICRLRGRQPQGREHPTPPTAMHPDMDIRSWLARAEVELKEGA